MSRQHIIPPGAPVQVFPTGNGLMYTKAEYLEHLKAKQAAIRQACDQGADVLARAFGVAPKQAQDFADAVHEAITCGLPKQIEFLENLKEPEPLTFPSGPWFGQPAIEQLADAQMNVDNWQEQLTLIENALENRGLDDTMKAAISMGRPMLKQQLQDAIRRRDQLQAEIDMQQEPIPPLPEERPTPAGQMQEDKPNA